MLETALMLDGDIEGLPDVRVVGKKLVVLLASISVEVFGKEWRMERGMHTDLASLPWFARFLAHWTQLALAGLWHDDRYAKKDVTRKEADLGFRDIAISGKIKTKVWKANIMYVFLRLFGWWPWYRVSDKILGLFKKQTG